MNNTEYELKIQPGNIISKISILNEYLVASSWDNVTI
jgi:hypothetical protein